MENQDPLWLETMMLVHRLRAFQRQPQAPIMGQYFRDAEQGKPTGLRGAIRKLRGNRGD